MWKTVKISDVCEFQSGLWKGKKKPFTNAYVIRNTNFRANGNLSYENVALLEVETKELSKRQLRHGDIILEKSGGGEKTPVGRVCLFEKQDNKTPFSLSNFTSLIRVKEPSILNYKYLHKFLYYMYGAGKTETMQRNSTGIRNLQLKQYKDISIILPPITEQKRIVAKLDRAFIKIDNLIKQDIEKKHEFTTLHENYKNNIFDNLINFEQKKLKEVCEKITDGTHQTPKYFDKGYVFLSSRNVKSKIINWEKIKYIDKKQHLEMQKRISPRKGDILLAKNGTTGMAAIVDKDIPFDIYVSLALLRSAGDVLPEYLLEFINSKAANKQFSERTKGIGVQNLHLQEIREVLIKYPKSKNKQKDVINKNQFINIAYKELYSLQEKIIDNLKTLKLAILKKELQI